jgi:hypothetical protein
MLDYEIIPRTERDDSTAEIVNRRDRCRRRSLPA